MRSRNFSRHSPSLIKVQRLIDLCLSLYASESRIEYHFWEIQIDTMIDAELFSGKQLILDTTLEELKYNYPRIYEIFVYMIENRSISFQITHENKIWNTLLLGIPILAWTRYKIPTGPINYKNYQVILKQLYNYIVAKNVKIALLPFLYSIDQLPYNYIETFQLTKQVVQDALQLKIPKIITNYKKVKQLPILADTRFLIAAIVAPIGDALFSWQKINISNLSNTRQKTLDNWIIHGNKALLPLFHGCEIKCLLPDAFYSVYRNADEKIRPYTIRTAVKYLTESLDIDIVNLRVIIGSFGEHQIDEYRISFTLKESNNVIYGIVWPIYNDNEYINTDDNSINDIYRSLNDINKLLHEIGINNIQRFVGYYKPEFCEDCGMPLYLNPRANIVHLEKFTKMFPVYFH